MNHELARIRNSRVSEITGITIVSITVCVSPFTIEPVGFKKNPWPFKMNYNRRDRRRDIVISMEAGFLSERDV